MAPLNDSGLGKQCEVSYMIPSQLEEPTHQHHDTAGSSIRSGQAVNQLRCLNQAADHSISEDSQTNLIIRNLVGHCSRSMLLDFMDRHQFWGRYNLVYLPQRFAGQGCFHYAFVNFVDHDAAMEFMGRLHGCNEADLFGEKLAEISWAQCQSLEANIEKYRNSSVMHSAVEDECKPLLFEDGKIVPFPKPTRKIRQERKTRKEFEDCKIK
jgi:hypothetical protein